MLPSWDFVALIEREQGAVVFWAYVGVIVFILSYVELMFNKMSVFLAVRQWQTTY